ncbi:MAG: ATP-binding cassette domain-containing protein [Erythrobacter sp.]
MQLRVDNVGLSYGGRQVLSEVSFGLEPGEHAMLLGPSGSGKSSLLNIVCGLQTPDSGAVMLGEHAMSGQADALRKRHMGIIFQTLRLVSALTVRANLLLAQKLQTGSIDEGLVDETLERLDIAHRAKARPFELSQGEAQRAAIARAVVVKPAILIADEPTSALDHANTQSVAQLLIEGAQEAGATLLIATHDDRLKSHFARTLVLENGALGEGLIPA